MVFGNHFERITKGIKHEIEMHSSCLILLGRNERWCSWPRFSLWCKFLSWDLSSKIFFSFCVCLSRCLSHGSTEFRWKIDFQPDEVMISSAYNTRIIVPFTFFIFSDSGSFSFGLDLSFFSHRWNGTKLKIENVYVWFLLTILQTKPKCP